MIRVLLAIALSAASAHAEAFVDGMTVSCRPIGPKVQLMASACGELAPSRVVVDGGAIHSGECVFWKVTNGPNARRSRCKAKIRRSDR